MSTHTLFLDSSIMESKENTNKIIDFCGYISTKITFAIHLSNYNLSINEYTKAYHDILNYYKEQDKNRRTDFSINSEYKKSLLDRYQSTEKALEYLDTLHKYDLIQLEEVKDLLINYTKHTPSTKLSILDKLGENRFVKMSLPKENLITSHFTFESHSTIGGLYKEFSFDMNYNMISYLLTEGDLLKFYTLENVDFLEDPAFYTNDKIILSISTHERTTTLFLTEEQYRDFKTLNIPYSENEVPLVGI